MSRSSTAISLQRRTGGSLKLFERLRLGWGSILRPGYLVEGPVPTPLDQETAERNMLFHIDGGTSQAEL